jgi:hypothetical protein
MKKGISSMSRQKWHGVFLLLGAIFLVACSLRSVETSESGGVTTSAARILIATENSKFKRAVVSDVRQGLKPGNPYIKVIDVKVLRRESTYDYDAVVIVNTCMAGRPDPRVEEFIQDAAEKDKLVVLTTGKLDSWKPDSREVDAITSASVMDQAAEVARQIVGAVLAKLDGKSGRQSS